MTTVTIVCHTANQSDVAYRMQGFMCLPRNDAPGLMGAHVTSEEGVTNILSGLFDHPFSDRDELAYLLDDYPLRCEVKGVVDEDITSGKVTVIAAYDVNIPNMNDTLAELTRIEEEYQQDKE